MTKEELDQYRSKLAARTFDGSDLEALGNSLMDEVEELRIENSRLGLIAEDHDCLAFPWDNHAPSRIQNKINAALEEAALICTEPKTLFAHDPVTARQCAERIRRLKVSAPEKTTVQP